jgi:phosphate uptake regulator
MITDMERIGDQAADISGLVIYLAGKPYIKKLEHLTQMAAAAIRMVTGACGRLCQARPRAGAPDHRDGRRDR